MEAVFIFPFTIYQCFFNQKDSFAINSFLAKQHLGIQLISSDFGFENYKEAEKQLEQQYIHMFLFSLEQNATGIIHFIKQLQSNPLYAYHPMVLFAQHPEDLISAFFSLKPFCSLLLPFQEQQEKKLLEYLKHYHALYEKDMEQVLEFDFSSVSYRFPIENIFFAEARNRKVTLHTTDHTETELPISFHEFLEHIPKNSLIQSHRSFAINPKKVSKVNKQHDHCIVTFLGTGKTALVSCSYKKEVLEISFSQICQNTIQTKQQSAHKD